MSVFDEDYVQTPEAPRTYDEANCEIFQQMREILLAKRRQRGTANIQEQGLHGVLNRLTHDKAQRVLRFTRRQQARDLAREFMSPGDLERHFPAPDAAELASVQDDLLDIANYAMIAVALVRGWWTLPDNEPPPPPQPEKTAEQLRLMYESDGEG